MTARAAKPRHHWRRIPIRGTYFLTWVAAKKGSGLHSESGGVGMVNTMQRYRAPLSNPDNSAEKQEAFVARLKELDDAAYLELAENRIWLSAFASNNPRSCYHWQVDACYDEAVRRGKPELYQQAWQRAAS